MKVSVVALLVAAVATSAHAQKGFSDCAKPGELRLGKGELLKVNCEFAVALNPEAYARLVEQRETFAKLAASLEENQKARDLLLSQEQQLVAELKKMNEIQARYYEALKEKYGELDKVAVESVENTRAALRLARGARISSYLTSGVLGGLGGGLAGSRVGGGGGLEVGVGAAAGALLGVGINWALLHLLGVQ